MSHVDVLMISRDRDVYTNNSMNNINNLLPAGYSIIPKDLNAYTDSLVSIYIIYKRFILDDDTMMIIQPSAFIHDDNDNDDDDEVQDAVRDDRRIKQEAPM